MPENQKIPALQAVGKLKSMGYSNYQIIDAMQAQGYQSNEIYDAINQYEVKNSMGQGAASPNGDYGGETADNSNGEYQGAVPPSQIDERIQEISEEIIAERWQEILNNIKKVVEWKNRTDERIKKIEADIENLKSQTENIQESILKKIKDYDTHITQFTSNFRAMESVFKEVLPQFTQSVQDLAEYIDELGGGKRKKSSTKGKKETKSSDKKKGVEGYLDIEE
jgi:chromosome segregation ATPase